MSTGSGPLFGSNQFSLPTTGGGSNQWMSYPSLPSGGMSAYGGSSSPTTMPNFSTLPGGPTLTGPPNSGNQVTPYPVGSTTQIGGGLETTPTMDPSFTGNFYSMLQSMLGGGAGLQNQLLQFLSGGGPSNIPGANQLENMSQTGGLISALPEWQSMVAAMGQNTAQNEAQLKEQFAGMGALDSSPFGTAMSDYLQQTNLNQNALLGQLDTQAMQQATQNELTASTSLTGMAGQESQFLDQLFSSAATSSPGVAKKGGSSSLLGGIGSLIGGAGSAAGGIGSLLSSLGIGAGAGAGGAADLAAALAGI